jgi:hypothetical protein
MRFFDLLLDSLPCPLYALFFRRIIAPPATSIAAFDTNTGTKPNALPLLRSINQLAKLTN